VYLRYLGQAGLNLSTLNISHARQPLYHFTHTLPTLLLYKQSDNQPCEKQTHRYPKDSEMSLDTATNLQFIRAHTGVHISLLIKHNPHTAHSLHGLVVTNQLNQPNKKKTHVCIKTNQKCIEMVYTRCAFQNNE
jgi:hypothetical protein